MSCNTNSPIARRQFLVALPALALAAWRPVHAGTATAPLAELRRLGSGEFRRFGISIYHATLWVSDTSVPTAMPAPPYALALEYRLAIASHRLAEASIAEMRALLGEGEHRLADWGARLAAIFPDVARGDRIVGIHRPEGARFHHNDRWLADVDDPDFARAFFGIWLDSRTSAPALRTSLLGRREA
jgi:hypothetical protein